MKIQYIKSEIYKLKRKSSLILIILIVFYNIKLSIDIPDGIEGNKYLIANFLYNKIFLIPGIYFLVVATAVFLAINLSKEIYENLTSYIIIKINSSINYFISKIILACMFFLFLLTLNVLQICIIIYLSDISNDIIQLFFLNFEFIDFVNIFIYCIGYIIIVVIISILIKNPFIVMPIVFVYMISETFILIFNEFEWSKWWMNIFPGYILSIYNMNVNGIIFLKLGYII
ncbi:MAG: hypothetical protein U9R42_06535, partial [Bacteroidota bacterium]|nr:hypothetical protein [Bacteroidota bacterium]